MSKFTQRVTIWNLFHSSVLFAFFILHFLSPSAKGGKLLVGDYEIS